MPFDSKRFVLSPLFVLTLAALPPIAVGQDEHAPLDGEAEAAASAKDELGSIPVNPEVPAETEDTLSKRGASRLIEEIVVTAQKREENLQNVPISVSAFTGDMLEARGVDDPTALAQVTPGLVYSSLLGYSLIYIRGVGSDAFEPTADQSVATYIDSVYLPFGHGLAQNFVKLDRVEVLKGPQGTLFGRNATGGAINIVTRKPAPGFEGSLDAGLSKHNGQDVKGFVTGPIVGSLYGSVSLIYTHEDSYYKLIDESYVQSLTPDITKGVNGRLQWDINDELSATISTLISRFSGTSAVINSAEEPKLLGQLAQVKAQGVREASLDLKPFLGTKNDLYYGQLAWTPAAFDIKLLGSHQEVHTNTNYDFDASSVNIAFFTVPNQFSKTTTAELQLLSKDDGVFPSWMQLTSGLYFYRSDAGYNPANLGAVGPDRLAALPVPPPLQSLISQLQPFVNGVREQLADFGDRIGVPLPTDFVNLGLFGHVQTTAYAAYLQSTFYLAEQFDITIGGRFQRERRGVRDPIASLNTSTGPLQLLHYQDDTTTRSSFSPKLTLDFKPTDHQLIYLTASEAEKSGTYNLPAVYTPPSYVKPETVRAFELGNKGEIIDGTLRYSAAIFYSTIDDLQTQIVSLASGGAQNLVNAAKAEIKGADIDITWQVFPDALPGFVMTAAGAYLDGRYKSFPDASGYDEVSGLYFGSNSLTGLPGRDFSGNRTVRTPKWSGTLGPNFAFDLDKGTVELGADVSYNSGFYFDTQNVAKQPSYTLVNARVSYLYNPWQLRLTAYAKNITGENYYINRFPTDFATNSTWANGVNYGLRAGWDF